MIQLSVGLENEVALQMLRNTQKKATFAIANALNSVVKKAQEEMRTAVQQRFTVRDRFRQFFLRQAAYIAKGDFASPTRGRLQARISARATGRLFLPSYETGFTRKANRGQEVAVPAIGGARPTKTSPVTSSLLIRKLQLRKGLLPRPVGVRSYRPRGGSGGPIRGLKRTYEVPHVGIFQRTGRGATRLLYGLARPFRVAARLRFIDTATKSALRWWPIFMKREVDDAIRHEQERGRL